MELKEKLISSFIAFENQIDIESPIHNIRVEAIKAFEHKGFPTKREEAWKYTSLNKILKEGVVLKVKHVYVDKMRAVVEMESLSTANNNKPFNNTYCWVVSFNENHVITAVRAYVDSALVQQAIDENE